ncbi:lamin tail domain-containing protein, partial [bacterium]|nr:lamin tail domain-containing protein [bacterium]
MKFATLVIIAGFAFLAVGIPAVEANPMLPVFLTEIGAGGSWLEFQVVEEWSLDSIRVEIDGQTLNWDECDTIEYEWLTIVFPWTLCPNPQGGIIRVHEYGYIVQEIAYGFAGNFPELPTNGSLIRLYHPMGFFEVWTVACNASTPGTDNPHIPWYTETLPPFVINEIYLPSSGAEDRFVELYNPTAEAINISGWSLYINNCDAFADGTVLQPYEFRTFTVATHAQIGHLNRNHDQIGLIDPDGKYYFTIKWTIPLETGYSWSLYPDADVTATGEQPFDISSFYEARLYTPGETNGGSGAEPEEPLPQNYSLAQNYPNPFNASTTFQFTVPETSPVKISVYDIEGREVTTLTNRSYMPGQ